MANPGDSIPRGDQLRKPRRGELYRPSTDAFHELLDARDFVRGLQHSGGAGDPSPFFPQSGIVEVLNNSGSNRDQFDVLGIDGPLISPADNADAFREAPAFSCSTPNSSTHNGKFVVLLEPIPSGMVGEACAAGVCVAKIGTASATSVGIVNGDATKLDSGYGADVLWVYNSGSAPYLAIVRFGISNVLRRFELKQSLDISSTHCDAYLLQNLGSGIVRTSTVFAVWNQPVGAYCGLGGDVMPTGQSGYMGYAAWMQDIQYWEIQAMERAASHLEFALAEDLNASEHTVYATILECHDGRSPVPNPGSDQIVLLNPSTAGSGYRYAAPSGTHGTAFHAPIHGMGAYVIDQMDCP